MKPLANKHQTGIATLATAIILLLVSTLIIFAVAKSAIFDQKNVGDELRTKELYEAAKGALEYGLAQLKTNSLNAWGDTKGSTTTPTAQLSYAAADFESGNAYETVVNYTRLTDADPAANKDRPIVMVSATARPTAGGDRHTSRTVSTMALRADIFGSGLGSAGPILLEGSMNGTVGTPELVPGPNGVVVTSLDPAGYIDATEGGAAATHGGTGAYATEQTSLGSALFGIDDPVMLDNFMYQLAQEDSRVYYKDSDVYDLGNLPASFDQPEDLATLDLDDVNNQHIVYYSSTAGCPKINGNPNIVGLVYISTPNCDNNGWGGCNIYGTVAFTGNMSNLNANCQFIGLDLTAFFDDLNDKAAIVSAIPGTWRDF